MKTGPVTAVGIMSQLTANKQSALLRMAESVKAGLNRPVASAQEPLASTTMVMNPDCRSEEEAGQTHGKGLGIEKAPKKRPAALEPCQISNNVASEIRPATNNSKAGENRPQTSNMDAFLSSDSSMECEFLTQEDEKEKSSENQDAESSHLNIIE